MPRIKLIDKMRTSPSRNINKITALNTLNRKNMGFSNFNDRIYDVEIEYNLGESGLEYW